jgi:predicted nucleic acid-binding protein
VAVVLLDAEALSVIAFPKERGAAGRRAQAVLEAAARRDSPVRVSAATLVEAYRGKGRDAGIDRVLNRGIEVLPVDRGTARVAARLLTRARLDSRSTVDAIVVATAIRLGAAVILTSDHDDLAALAADHPAVEIRPLT